MKKECYKKIRKRVLFYILSAASLGLYAQDVNVSGNLKDPGGIPLAGASVIQLGTTNGTQSDFDGNYSINVPSDAQLQFSFIGYTSKTVTVDGQTTLDIILEEDAQSLDEVVVVGYGTSKKKDITGAVTRVELEDSPVALAANTNILQTIRGSTPGVNIGAQNSAGGTPSILVRGTNSLGGEGNNNPLIILDGIIFLGTLADINPNDIASVDILKDASTAVVYGSRAANGVILINTKRGKTDKPVIKLSTSAGFNRWQNQPELLARDAYLEKYAVQIGATSVDAIVWEEEYRDVLQDEGVDTDWIDLISRSGFIQKHNISVSGQTKKTNYFISGAYEEQEGVIIGDEFERISVRTRLQTNVTDWLQVGIDGSYTNSDFSGEEADVRQANILAPIGYPYRYDGQPFNTASNTSRDLERFPTANNVQNPLWGTDGTKENFDTRNYFRMALNTKLDIPWIKGLSYSFNYSLSAQYREEDEFEFETYHIVLPSAQPYFERYSPAFLQQNLAQANGSSTRTRDYTYVWDNIINYNNTFGKSNIDVTLVATRDYRNIEEDNITGTDFSVLGNTTLGANGLPFANTVQTSKDIIERANVGYLARLSYGYDSKYNFNAAVRRDGASVFGSDEKYATFWSVGGAWTLTEEDFIGKSDFLNYLKLNVSYGTNGNQGLSPFGTLSPVDNGRPGGIGIGFGNDPSTVLFGTAQTELGNSSLGWEETTSLNIGIHASLLKNRVSFDADIYFSETEDQIFPRQIPTTSGFSTVLASLGQVDNNGVEIAISSKNIATKDLTWTSSLTYWRNRNELASLFGDDNDGDGVEDDDIGNSLFIGESLGAIYGFEFIGVVQESDTQYIADTGAVPGDPMFRDLDGLPGITAEGDRKILGFDRPNFRMSLANTVTYKNLTLYTLFTGTFGGNGYYLGENPRQNSLQNRFDFNDVVNGDFWTSENQSTTNLRPDFNDDRFLGLQSRSFVRLQNVNLSYRFNQKLLDRLNIGLTSLEVYASADNPAIFTDWFGGGDPEFTFTDPDNSGSGVFNNASDSDSNLRGVPAQSGTLPVMSSYTFGLNVSF